MSSFPHHLTDAELEILPTGPMRVVEELDLKTGLTRLKPIMEATRVMYHEPHDPLVWCDSKGRTWMFGQFANGEWFKRPAP